jgi:hypothetical protein
MRDLLDFYENFTRVLPPFIKLIGHMQDRIGAEMGEPGKKSQQRKIRLSSFLIFSFEQKSSEMQKK